MLPADSPSDPTFAGDLLLGLARDGRLVLDAAQADEVIAGLERTLSVVLTRLRTVRWYRQAPGPLLAGQPDEAAVDAMFAEQLAPGRLERAAVELPKYIEALRSAQQNRCDLL